MKNITIYSTDTCTYCSMAKDYFKSKNLEYTEFNVGADVEKRKEMVTKSGQMGVPVLDIGGSIIVGFDQAKVDAALAA
jgi:glutaredoxin-like YruB-family protein